jgi:hypothetical protein
MRAKPVEPGGEPAGTATAKAQPGYETLVERQTNKPAQRFTPCNLVTAAQARAIIGRPIRQPLEAPQGPTCIYRTRRGNGFVSLAIQTTNVNDLKQRIEKRRRVRIAARTAYCGWYGQAVLYLPLGRSSVLSVAARCPLARQFAAAAVRRLPA